MAFTSQPYTVAMVIRPAVSHTTYATYSWGKTGDIIMFAKFEEGNLWSETQDLLSETCDNTESGNESNVSSNMPQLILKKKWM